MVKLDKKEDLKGKKQQREKSRYTGHLERGRKMKKKTSEKSRRKTKRR
jgi:hypothetical protein